MPLLQSALVTVFAVAAAAYLLRLASGGSRDEFGGSAWPSAGVTGETVEPASESEPGEEEDSGEVVAITSNGSAFVPDGDAVVLIPPGESDEDGANAPATSGAASAGEDRADDTSTSPLKDLVLVNPVTGRPLRSLRFRHFDPGDLIAARVRRGGDAGAPWRLETLDRERELDDWSFETEDAARAALALLEAHVVRAPVDENGEPAPVSDAEFDEAQRPYEQAVPEFDQPDDG